MFSQFKLFMAMQIKIGKSYQVITCKLSVFPLENSFRGREAAVSILTMRAFSFGFCLFPSQLTK